MIKSFACNETEKIFNGNKSKILPSKLLKKALIKLTMIDASENVDDLRIPPSNRLHKLKGTRKEEYSISINDKYRICFKWADNNAYDVEITNHYK